MKVNEKVVVKFVQKLMLYMNGVVFSKNLSALFIFLGFFQMIYLADPNFFLITVMPGVKRIHDFDIKYSYDYITIKDTSIIHLCNPIRSTRIV